MRAANGPRRSAVECTTLAHGMTPTELFGDDPNGALREYLEVKDSLQTGQRRTQLRKDGVTVKNVVEHFMESKQRQMDAGELSPRSHAEYRLTGGRVIEHFGTLAIRAIEPLDFAEYRAKMAKTRGAVSLGNEIQRVRTIFKYAHDAQVIDKPVRFGPEFKKPSRATIRRAKQAAGPKLFTASEINALLDEVGTHLHAMRQRSSRAEQAKGQENRQRADGQNSAVTREDLERIEKYFVHDASSFMRFSASRMIRFNSENSCLVRELSSTRWATSGTMLP